MYYHQLREWYALHLHYWGLTAKDAAEARSDAFLKLSMMHGKQPSEVKSETHDVGGKCPIQRRDPVALYQGATYNAAWVIYEDADAIASEDEKS